jgi:hypothetical protein
MYVASPAQFPTGTSALMTRGEPAGCQRVWMRQSPPGQRALPMPTMPPLHVYPCAADLRQRVEPVTSSRVVIISL